MGERNSPFGSFKSIRQEPLPTDIRLAAISHEIGRQREVMNVLLHMYVMAGVGVIELSDVIDSSGAKLQHLTGNKPSGTNAAHCVPCQILIGVGKKTPQEISEEKKPGFEGDIFTSFSMTDILPLNFNKADSLAESKGLVDAFVNACVRAVRLAHSRRRYFRNSIYPDVMSSYDLYKSRGVISFDRAINHLFDRLASITVLEERRRLQERVRILEHYKQTLETSNGHLENFMLIDVEKTLKDYS